MLKPDGYVFIKTLLIYGSKRRASSPYKERERSSCFGDSRTKGRTIKKTSMER